MGLDLFGSKTNTKNKSFLLIVIIQTYWQKKVYFLAAHLFRQLDERKGKKRKEKKRSLLVGDSKEAEAGKR